MKVLDLFAGIGGFSLAAHWMGWETVAFVEIDPFCQKVLKKNFPNTPVYGDIKNFDGTEYNGTVDLICGGFPCQPFSDAGFKMGKNDDRYLWHENIRVIRKVKPRWVVSENVFGLVTMDDGAILGEILTSLENEGYKPEVFIIPACAVGAPHKRNRVWIVAYSGSIEQNAIISKDCKTENIGRKPEKWSEAWEQFKLVAGIGHSQFGFYNGYNIEPCVVRSNDGVSDRMDRLKSLGNAVVPQVVYEIFKAIEGIEI